MPGGGHVGNWGIGELGIGTSSTSNTHEYNAEWGEGLVRLWGVRGVSKGKKEENQMSARAKPNKRKIIIKRDTE